MLNFLYHYVRSMRLYYCFITGCTTLAGILTAKAPGYDWHRRDAVILVIGFAAWGVNQIFSDWCDRREDAVNAPHRPMVTGALKPFPALVLSGMLMLSFAVISCLISPWTLAVLSLGGILNLLYSALKKVPVLNTVIYGSAISLCAAYGWIGSLGGLPTGRNLYGLPVLCLLVLPAHIIMCHNSYFKDVAGDTAAGIRTLAGLYPRFSLWLSASGAAFYALFITALRLRTACAAYCGLILLYLSALILWNTLNLAKKNYHRATCSNCQLCAAFLLVFAGRLPALPAVMLQVAVFLSIQLIFLWYPDEKE